MNFLGLLAALALAQAPPRVGPPSLEELGCEWNVMFDGAEARSGALPVTAAGGGLAARLAPYAPVEEGPDPLFAVETVEADASLRDSDGDGMADEEELRAALEAAPLLVWSDNEKCGAHDAFFQVRPNGDGSARITYALLFPVDCGFRSSGLGGHPGDTQEILVDAALASGTWRAVKIDVPWHRAVRPRDGERARLYVSAGKHHIYPSASSCGWGKFLFLDQCGGGQTAAPAVRAELNVGEADRPAFVTLEHFARGRWASGYAKESSWGVNLFGDQDFCGGDAKRGGKGSWQAKLKALLNWSHCGDGMGKKWAEPPPNGMIGPL